ncbi:MAG: FemAB family PEP-CTERM system-associated protein [Anaerolineae bacterium]
MVTVIELSDQACAAWDNYVKNSRYGLPQHLSGWRRVLHKTHGYETAYLMALEGGRIVGVLPLFVIRNWLTGHTASTMPGGLCADSEEVAAQLIEHGKEVARQVKAKRLILQDTRQVWPGDFHTTTHHVHWVVNVKMPAETLWKGLDGNIRRQVRIARRNNLSVEIDRTGKCLDTFYHVFSRCAHQMGSPVFGRDFLEHIIETFPDGFNIAIVRQEQKPVGAYFQLEMGRTVYGLWGATLREYLKQRPVYLAYWEILREASQNGFHFLDMGRSPVDSNASRFKGQWGGVARPIYQQATGIKDTDSAESITSQLQSDGRLRLVMQLWPRLPLPVVQFLGPRLRRYVPFA